MIVRSTIRWLALLSVAYAAHKSAPKPPSAPLRDLPWGQLNFLHTTDTHGWHAGHLQESSYSADWGDYISFARHLRARADAEGTDLLLIDTGDRIEGNGLYDASDPKGVYTRQIFAAQDIDVLCSGNHELYQRNSSDNEYTGLVPAFGGNYLASNLDILDPKTGDRVPLAARYRKFTTKNQGIRVLAFGFLFDFTGNANNTFVQPVEQTIEEPWFHDAIRDEGIDLIVVAGHVALRDQDEFQKIFTAIRSARWDTPIHFFGGHAHVRDYKKFDGKALGLASGRYMETIGFASITGLSTSDKGKHFEKATLAPTIVTTTVKGPSYARRYIDNNLSSFYHHASLNASTFPTSHGRNVSNLITTARNALKLDTRYGCAPQNFWTNRAPYPDEYSIFSWLQTQVLPDMVNDTARAEKPRIIIANTGALRFDIFKGPFTRDTTFSVSPFPSGFNYIADVPLEIADKILQVLNNAGEILGLHTNAWMMSAPENMGHVASSAVGADDDARLPAPNVGRPGSQKPLSPKTDDDDEEEPELTPGYTTKDDAGTDGDDTVHAPITFFKVPNCIESRVGLAEASRLTDDGDTGRRPTVDLVYLEFIQPWMMLALRFLGAEYTAADVEPYMEGKGFTEMIREWVGEHWDGDC